MFTGIVEEKGSIKSVELNGVSGSLNIRAKKVLEGTKIGDSIAVNGVCLTVTSMTGDGFSADVMAETVRRTSLGSLKMGSFVNLERAMAADGRFGGHIVAGHVDGTGTISKIEPEGNAVWVTISCDESVLKYIIEKGSIAIDGVSLTVAYIDEVCFKVSLIPHTAKETTLLDKKVGEIVNLENDMVGKYVEKLILGGSVGLSGDSALGGSNSKGARGSVTMEKLLENGFL